MSSSCSQCRSKALERDEATGQLVCEACGLLQEFDGFEAHFGGISGPQGTFVRLGTAGAGTILSYRDKKLLDARSLIDDVAFRLGLSAAKSAQIRAMASDVTGGDLGAGRWFSIFVAACAYVVMRSDSKPLPIAEVSSVAGCDDHELGRMVDRLVRFLDLRSSSDYPGPDVVALLERALRNSPSLAAESSDKAERMRRQGVFLVQCMVKWSLTTGRRPAALVAAALAFVGEVNGVEAAGIEVLARELRANAHTCKQRYRELSEALVKVAQALPWGSNVTVKNIVKNAPFVIQYMEKKSMLSGERRNNLDRLGFDLDDAVRECLRKDICYGSELVLENCESRYFDRRNNIGIEKLKLKLSPECLSMAYEKFQASSKSARESGELHRRERERKGTGFELDDCADWWDGESEMSKKLLLRQILDKDVGLDALPPSFVASCKIYAKRREKIKAAKQRIERIMRPRPPGSFSVSAVAGEEDSGLGKKRRAEKVGAVDWEDMIIEALLLHEVKEEEILTGHYNALMDLYVL